MINPLRTVSGGRPNSNFRISTLFGTSTAIGIRSHLPLKSMYLLESSIIRTRQRTDRSSVIGDEK